ncbi:hypothetical protein F5X68DRAFT_4146 [Plectosphaerella plurivora]|uniref:Uncharacterized protein n=1 Tax=Plectosphaerella plurivora TaxID=936078 RepID=A0A9P8VMV5_9PEZI|nr:hypothetical protein F5X68DRAFT_4146 [Plectosphaerella plurivora]
MPPRQPPFHPQGPRPPGPPFFNQPPFHPGSAPPRPPSSLQSGSEGSSSRQSSTAESSHSVDSGPPNIPAQPPVPQRTAFYGEPKYAEYQLPGERQVSPEPAFPSALAEDINVSPWTDVTRVSWTKGRVGDIEDEPLEGALPIAIPPPFPPGPGGMSFGAQPPPNAFQAPPQPGNMPPPGMQPFPG